MILPKEVRNPIEVEPPDWIGHELANRKSRSLAMRDQLEPRNPSAHLIGRVRLNVSQFCFREARMRFGLRVQRDPEGKPQQTNCAGQNKSPLPTPVNRNPGHRERSNDGADIRAGVKDAGGKGALFFGKPFRSSFDRGWKISGLADAQGGPGHPKTKSRPRESMAHGRDAPNN